MFAKLNVREIIEGHNLSFLDKNHKFIIGDYFTYKCFPYLLALLFIFLKIPDENVKNIFGICLSILIGLFLNILVLLTSNISSEKLNLSSIQKQIRLELLEQTLYNVSFSVLSSVKALIVLFLMSILSINIKAIDNIFLLFFNFDLNHFLQLIFGLFLYKYSIEIFLILYMILKRINKLFTNEIVIEKLKIKGLKEIEEKE
jgi:hypothetical protein